MKKTTLNYIIDILIGLGFLTSAVTGIYLFFTTLYSKTIRSDWLMCFFIKHCFFT